MQPATAESALRSCDAIAGDDGDGDADDRMSLCHATVGASAATLSTVQIALDVRYGCAVPTGAGVMLGVPAANHAARAQGSDPEGRSAALDVIARALQIDSLS